MLCGRPELDCTQAPARFRMFGPTGRAATFEGIDRRSHTPIYAQIAECVRVAVARGELGKGNRLPSVRVLARRLRVNPATVVQAYRELQHEKLVETRQGAGAFVADVPADERAQQRTADAKRLARDVVGEAARRGLGRSEILRAVSDELVSRPMTGSGRIGR